MGKFFEQLFYCKNGYQFSLSEKDTASEVLFRELHYHTSDLEQRWLLVSETEDLDWESFSEHLNRFSERLGELIRFLNRQNGPKIVLFTANELHDFVQHTLSTETFLPLEAVDQVSVIVTSLNSYLNPELLALNVLQEGDIAYLLKKALNGLMEQI